MWSVVSMDDSKGLPPVMLLCMTDLTFDGQWVMKTHI